MTDYSWAPMTAAITHHTPLVDTKSGMTTRPSEIDGSNFGYGTFNNRTSHISFNGSVNPNQPILYDLSTTVFNMAPCLAPEGIVGLLLIGFLL